MYMQFATSLWGKLYVAKLPVTSSMNLSEKTDPTKEGHTRLAARLLTSQLCNVVDVQDGSEERRAEHVADGREQRNDMVVRIELVPPEEGDHPTRN